MNDHTVAVEIGARLRDAMVSRGVSIRRLARTAAISRPALHDYLIGRRTPSAERLLTLAEALHVAPGDLLPCRAERHVA